MADGSWRVIAHYARLCLMLGDHNYSSQGMTHNGTVILHFMPTHTKSAILTIFRKLHLNRNLMNISSRSLKLLEILQKHYLILKVNRRLLVMFQSLHMIKTAQGNLVGKKMRLIQFINTAKSVMMTLKVILLSIWRVLAAVKRGLMPKSCKHYLKINRVYVIF